MKAALALPRGSGPWLWLALAAGALVRAWLVLGTEGTFDVAIAAHHGSQIRELGLVEYYRRAAVMNHPPPAGELFRLALGAAEATGIPFRVVWRAPFALLDLGSALALALLWPQRATRPAVLAAYWLHPLAILFSAYHGNTDTAVAFAALLAVMAASRRRPGLAGVALGLGLWIKLPVLLVAPALFAALPTWAERGRLAAAAAALAAPGYLPVALVDPGLLVERVFGYPGSGVMTPRGIAVWGIAHTLRLAGGGVGEWLVRYNTVVCWAPLLLLAWLRRGRITAPEIGATVCGGFLLFYGLSSFWAWQYLAWSVPFWIFLGWRFALVATAVVGGYVYAVYALFTGSLLLRGRWDFVGHAPWPDWLDLLRDAAVLVCLAGGCLVLLRALREARGRPAPGAG